MSAGAVSVPIAMLMPRLRQEEKDESVLPPRLDTSGQWTIDTPFSAYSARSSSVALVACGAISLSLRSPALASQTGAVEP